MHVGQDSQQSRWNRGVASLHANIRSDMIELSPIERLQRALTASSGRPKRVQQLLAALGWKDVSELPFTVDGADFLLEMRAAAQPRAVAVVGTKPDAPQSATLTYSREAPYLLLWGHDEIALHDAQVWTDLPGDAPVYAARTTEPEGLSDLIALVRRPEVLSRAPDALVSKGRRHIGLPQRLAESLATLRLRFADADAFKGIDPAARDGTLLAFFHQLLYIRVVEDRGTVTPPERIEGLLDGRDVAPRLAALGTWYAHQLDSELFEPTGLNMDELPPDALIDVMRALVEPWKALRLDFSVTQTELASRLYESYLASVPAVAVDDRLQLFPSATVSDRRDLQASFYTPPGLAQAVATRALEAFVSGREVDPFSIRVVDPACGSGAFLIMAFRWLQSYAERVLERELTLAERLALLRGSIFGADVDERALALTRIQLLEEARVTGRLPNLADNLFLGDALAAPPPHVASELGGAAVDWTSLLARVGHFSVVMGNPPFGSEIKLPGRLTVSSIRQLDKAFPEVRGFGRDYAYLFGALALRILTDDGTAGLVMPRKLLDGSSGSKLRSLLAARGVAWLADLRAASIFPGVKTRACVVVLQPRKGNSTDVVSIADSREEPSQALDDLLRPGVGLSVSPAALVDAAPRGWSPFRLRWETDLQHEIRAELDELAPEGHDERDVRFGTKPANVDKLVLKADEWTPLAGAKIRMSGVVIPDRYAPLIIYARQLRPFALTAEGNRLLLPFEADGSFTTNRLVLEELERRGGLPKNFQRGDLRTLLSPKVLVRAVTREPAAYADVGGKYLPIMRGALAVRADDLGGQGLRALAALLNSAFYQWLIRGLGSPLRDEFVELSAADVRRLPFPRLKAHDMDGLASSAAAIEQTLGLQDGRTRAAEYRRLRHDLDIRTFELVGASPRLRTLVLDELLRDT